MFNPLKGIGDLNEMRKQAMTIQKALQEEKLTVEKHGVIVVISGDQKVLSIDTHGASDDKLKDAINEAIKKSQEVAAKKLSQMGGGLGGMFGGK